MQHNRAQWQDIAAELNEFICGGTWCLVLAAQLQLVSYQEGGYAFETTGY